MTDVLPVNLEAERSVLGAMMVSASSVGPVIVDVGLKADDFYRERHRIVYEAILALDRSSSAIDVLTVTEFLREHGRLEKAGGPAEVQSLPDQVPAPGNFAHYARIVRQNALLRRLLVASQKISSAVHGRQGSPQEIAQHAEKLIAGAAEPERASRWYDADRQLEVMDKMAAGRMEAEFRYPLAKLNEYGAGGGIMRGHTIVVAAATSMGKSHFVDDILDCNREHKVALYMAEMDVSERAARRAARLVGVKAARVQRGSLDDVDRQLWASHRENSDARWPICDAAGMTSAEIASEIRRRRDDLVVVDHLHKLADRNEKGESTSQRFARMIHTLSEAAKVSGTALIVAAQLSRSIYDSGGNRRRPALPDLKESGDIENAADAVLFIHRAQDQKTKRSLPEGEIYFDKNRGGSGLGGVLVELLVPDLRFRPRGEADEPAPQPELVSAFDED